jgi:hypothetical protein
VGRRDGRILLYQTDGKHVGELPPADREVEVLAWSPDSGLVAVGSASGNVRLWRRDGTLLRQLLPPCETGFSSMRFSPDGRCLLAGRNSRVWDIRSGDQVLQLPGAAWGFTRDGRRLALGGWASAMLCEYKPAGISELHGHRAGIAQFAWSRDKRHVATLDTNFEVRVWDVARADLVNAFAEVPGAYYAGGAAIALSDDGRQLAYANGGESRVVIHEVSSGRKLTDEWKLPPGFERLACLRGANFLLVREEPEADGMTTRQSAAWEFAVGMPPRPRSILRPAVRGEKSFFDQCLSSDGRYYCWDGPRFPPANHRIEVYELARGRRVRKVEQPTEREQQFSRSLISPDGRRLWVATDAGAYLRYGSPHGMSLADDVGTPVPAVPLAASPDHRWLAFGLPADERRLAVRVALHHEGDDSPWLEFSNPDQEGPTAVSFSLDGRYLIWGSHAGVITVADLEVLQKEVGQFEKCFARK